MKRLLCIVGGMNTGGAETFLMKIYRSLDRNNYQMDFCVSKPQKGFYDDEIIELGGRIIHTVPKSRNPLASFFSIYQIVKKNQYDYVMRISQHSLSAMELLAAKLAGAKVRAFRSSNSMTMEGGISFKLHQIFKFLPNIVANVRIAPSRAAANFMFGGKKVQKGEVFLLKNGIPLETFSYDEQAAKSIRSELGIGNQLVLGHIGRFSAQKNHEYLVDVFTMVLKEDPTAILMMVGEGELEDSIRQKLVDLNIMDNVRFMGVRKDVPSLLSVMDVFVFPSLYEGLPNTVIEAQANGLPCVIADSITSEVSICSNVERLPLAQIEKWKDAIFASKRNSDKENQMVLRENGYDIQDVATEFVNIIFEDM